MSNTDLCIEMIKNNNVESFTGFLADVDYLKIYRELGFHNGMNERNFFFIQRYYFTSLYNAGLLQKIWIELQEKGINPLNHYLFNMETKLIKYILSLENMPPLYVPFDKKILPYLKKTIRRKSINKYVAELVYYSTVFGFLLDKHVTYKTIANDFPHMTHEIDMRNVQTIYEKLCN